MSETKTELVCREAFEEKGAVKLLRETIQDALDAVPALS